MGRGGKRNRIKTDTRENELSTSNISNKQKETENKNVCGEKWELDILKHRPALTKLKCTGVVKTGVQRFSDNGKVEMIVNTDDSAIYQSGGDGRFVIRGGGWKDGTK